MNQRRYPAWLLRDVPAFFGVVLSFFPLAIFVIAGERLFARDSSFRPFFREQVAILLANAEARLNHAFWREAYRRLGWDPKLVQYQPIEPMSWADTLPRYFAYRDAFYDMEGMARRYVEHLRAQYGLGKTALAAYGSTDARLRRAAHHELVGVGRFISQSAPLALILSSARMARPSKDQRCCAHARGPPLPFPKPETPTSHAPRTRSHRHVRTRTRCATITFPPQASHPRHIRLQFHPEPLAQQLRSAC